MRDGLHLKGSDCLGTVLLVELGGLSDSKMADGLMTLVDDVNLKGVSLLARGLGFEAEGAGRGGGLTYSIKQANSTPKGGFPLFAETTSSELASTR